jgi:hypothetical protein
MDSTSISKFFVRTPRIDVLSMFTKDIENMLLKEAANKEGDTDTKPTSENVIDAEYVDVDDLKQIE